MTQPLPEPRHFNPHGGQDPENSPNLLEGRHGMVAVVATHEAHASGWAAEATVGLAEASQRAGHPTGVLDLAVGAPRLHEAAGIEPGEGLIDLVIFGASLDRVSHELESGVRVVTAGTPVAEESELWTAPDGDTDKDTPEAAWVGAARELADHGCVLLYVVADSVGVDHVLEAAQDVILIRHEGDRGATLLAHPFLVLEPQPAATINAEILPAPLFDDETTSAPEIMADAEILPAPVLGEEEVDEGIEEEVDQGIEAVDDGIEEVVLDLDDVIDDSPLHDNILGADRESATPAIHDVVQDADVSGLEVNSEWPAFQEPLEVQDPGSVDPLVAAASDVETTTPDMGLEDIVGGESGLTIVTEDLGAADERLPDPGTPPGTIDGLIDGAQDTLSRAGEDGLPSADEVTGLEEAPIVSPLHDPTGWGPPPSARDEPPAAADLALDDLTPGTDGAGFDGDTPTFAGPPSERSWMEESPAESGRLADPWGEPTEEPEPAVAEPSPLLETASLADEATPPPETEAAAESLPWEERVEEGAGAVAKEAEVPVAKVTRTRTRRSSNGPRPFLLVLFLLLVITVGVLWWVEVLDVPLLDGLRGGAP